LFSTPHSFPFLETCLTLVVFFWQHGYPSSIDQHASSLAAGVCKAAVVVIVVTVSSGTQIANFSLWNSHLKPCSQHGEASGKLVPPHGL
jgi:hypothetical protein